VKYIPRVLHYVRPYWHLAAISVVLLVLASLVSVLAPVPLKLIIDSVAGEVPLPSFLRVILGGLADNRYTLLVIIVVAGLGIRLAEHGLGVLDSYVNTKLDLNMALDFRSELFQHLQRLSLAFHERRRAGMTMYVNMMGEAPATLVMAIPGLAQSVLTLVLMFWITCSLNWQIALLSLVVVPFLYYSVGYYVKRIQTRLWEVKMMEGMAFAIIHEAVSMLRVIIAFGRESYEHRRFRDQTKQAVDARLKLTLRQTLFALAVDLTTGIGIALVLGVGAYHVLQDLPKPPEERFTIGALTQVLYYVTMVYKPLETISTTVGSLQDVLVNLKMTFGLLDTEPDIKDAPGAISIERCRGHIVYENASFNYMSRVETLKNISFEAKPGQVIAIVGPTGAGKTTLISLLPRFYDLKQGRILLDGKDIQQLTLKSLRAQISIVLQEPLLFSGTILENIRYGRLEATTDEVMEAAKAANAHDFIMALPNQYETELGERGVQISGGERQRVAVARAFLKDAPILILDEPTSSVDSKTEAVILDALDRLMVGRTTFLIAHRFSTIRNADRILVLNNGQLVEEGTHDDLMQHEGLYKQLRDLQTRQTRRQLQAAPDGFLEDALEELP
jgi:ABC-type multidrug transport system fused ATPase/permease subunit